MQIKVVKYAFIGIRACVIYLIISAGIRLFRGMKKSRLSYFLTFGVMAAMIAFALFSVKFSTVFYILIGGAIGCAVQMIGGMKGKGGDAHDRS